MRAIPNLLVAVGMLALAPASLLAAPCTTTISVGTSIQTTIDSATAGDVICLNAGTYEEGDKIDVDKALTIQGPQFGVDPRPLVGSARVPGGPAEAILAGTNSVSSGVMVILASDVVIDGLQFHDSGDDMLDADIVPVSNVEIRNNIISEAGDEGIQLKESTDAVIENNYIFDNAGDAINVSDNSTGAVIQYNQLVDIHSTNAAIYIYGNTTNSLVLTNIIDTTTDNDGIKLGIKTTGADSQVQGGMILHNRVSNPTQDGISVYSSGVLVQGNAITGSTSGNGAIYATFDVDGTDINSNTILNNTTTGVKIGGVTNQYPTNTLVNLNCIAGNSVGGMVAFVDPGPVDATNNWWGSADGPSGQGPGTGDSVGTDITFDPFLTEDCTLLDPDNDGIFNKFDNCPDVFNERQIDTNPNTPEGDACANVEPPRARSIAVPVNNPWVLMTLMLLIVIVGGIGTMLAGNRN